MRAMCGLEGREQLRDQSVDTISGDRSTAGAEGYRGFGRNDASWPVPMQADSGFACASVNIMMSWSTRDTVTGMSSTTNTVRQSNRRVSELPGTSPDGRLVEMVEFPDHPWFLAVQFHPEFTSRPNRPQPLFRGFVRAALASC